jgi:hypothetical protein
MNFRTADISGHELSYGSGLDEGNEYAAGGPVIKPVMPE